MLCPAERNTPPALASLRPGTRYFNIYSHQPGGVEGYVARVKNGAVLICVPPYKVVVKKQKDGDLPYQSAFTCDFDAKRAGARCTRLL